MAVPRSFVSTGPEESPGPPWRQAQLNKESVFEWFGLGLTPAKRIEFMCGLLHMCQPLELRFLGSYLEDLARKDYHILRDFEFRANSANDLAVLTDVTDPVVLSKLLICLSLLGSDNRDCAGILYRTLSHADPTMFYRNSEYSPSPFRESLQHPLYASLEQRCGGGFPNEQAAGPLEHLSLLLTMASLHPAFHFHQGEKLREQLDKLDLIVEATPHFRGDTPEETGPKYFHCSSDLEECPASHPACKSLHSNCGLPQTMHIKEIVLQSVARTTVEKEYHFQIKWSDSSLSHVTKTHLELENFLLKLPKNNCSESFERSILRLLHRGRETADSCDVEKILREKFLSAPPVFKQIRKVCSFFNSSSSYSVKAAYCRCHCQLGTIYHKDCSDFSSQEEDFGSYVQGHKKKHGLKSPCQGSLSSMKSLLADSRRGGHRADLSGPVEGRKSSSGRSSQEAEQHQEPEKKSSPTAKSKGRGGEGAKVKEKTVFVANGRLVPVLKPQSKKACGVDTFGETSSESYSSPSSPQHRRAESLDSEDDNNKDSDSNSDYLRKGPGPDSFWSHQTDGKAPPLKTLAQVLPPWSQSGTDRLPTPPYMHHLPCWLPSGAAGSPVSSVHLLDQSMVPDVPDMRPSPGTPLMPNAPPALSGVLADPEKKDLVASGLQPVGGSAVSVQVPVRTISVLSPGPTAYCSPLQPDQASVGTGPPTMDTQVATDSSLLAPLGPAFTPASATATPAAGTPSASAAVVPPAAPSHAPAPPQSPSPAVTHSTAAYSNSKSSTVTHGNTVTVQQVQQQLLGCGACGCHNNCGGRTSVPNNGGSSVSSCQAPLLFAGHQAAAARQVFSSPAPLFQLASLCGSTSGSYLAQPPPHVAGAASLSPFFASAPPAYAPLHPQSAAEVPSHILGMQAVAAVATANYGLQQQMAVSAQSVCQRLYQQQMYPHLLAMMPTATLPRSGVNKKNGNVSCYNCGLSGHYAQECNQLSKDSSQPGGFRLKYTASHLSEMLDNGD